MALAFVIAVDVLQDEGLQGLVAAGLLLHGREAPVCEVRFVDPLAVDAVHVVLQELVPLVLLLFKCLLRLFLNDQVLSTNTLNFLLGAVLFGYEGVGFG